MKLNIFITLTGVFHLVNSIPSWPKLQCFGPGHTYSNWFRPNKFAWWWLLCRMIMLCFIISVTKFSHHIVNHCVLLWYLYDYFIFLIWYLRLLRVWQRRNQEFSEFLIFENCGQNMSRILILNVWAWREMKYQLLYCTCGIISIFSFF